MPKSALRRYGIAPSKVVSLVHFEVVKRLTRKLLRRELSVLGYAEVFGKAAARALKGEASGVVISFAGYSLEVLRRVKDSGGISILDRGSTHTLANQKLLRQAFESAGKAYVPHPQAFVDRELEEYELSDYILVPSNFVKQTFTEHGVPEEKLIQIPYGADASLFPMNERLPPEGRFVVLYVGQQKIRKGTHLLVEAARRLPHLEFQLVGPWASELDDLRSDLPRNVTAYGLVSRDRLKEFYHEASVFCIASFEEGMALVQLEALSCGLPIVCTRPTGGEDLIVEGETGCVVQPGDIEGLVSTLSKLSEDRKCLERMKQAVVDRKNETYDWNRYGDKLERELEEVQLCRS